MEHQTGLRAQRFKMSLRLMNASAIAHHAAEATPFGVVVGGARLGAINHFTSVADVVDNLYKTG